MRGLKPFLGLLSSLLGVLYFGGLFFHFYRVSGGMGDSETNGLGPTLIGLAAVTVLLSIPLLFKLIMLVIAMRSPRGGGDAKDDDGFDADAVIARYQAPPRGAPPSDPKPRSEPRSFGRKRR